MPDGIVSQRDFVQTMGQNEQDMQLAITSGNTVVFDSFTPELEVRRRNLMNNNISKLNETSRHFRTEFGVRVHASRVAAVLCAGTVAEYRVVDRKTDQKLLPSDKRPKYIKEYQSAPKADNATKPADHPLVRKRKIGPSAPFEPLRVESVFCHPGLPRCDIAGAMQMMIPGPTLAHFASPPTSPRTVDNTGEGDIGPIPFPFNPFNIDTSDALREQSTVSDNVRAVVSVHDVLHSGIHHADRSPAVSDSVLSFNPLYEDLRKHADLLLTMHQSTIHSQGPA